MPKRKWRGSALATVTAVAGVSLLAAVTVAGAAAFHLQLAVRSDNIQIAGGYAESALEQAVARLMEDGRWAGTVTIPGDVPGEGATLTFHPASGQPYSTNNVDSNHHDDAWKGSRLLVAGQVPAEHIHLVAVGRCRGAVRTAEAVVHVPNYTFSLSSYGPVVLDNSTIGSLKDPADFQHLNDDPTLLGPGDLATNDDSANSVVLRHRSRVTGNVQSCGRVQLMDNSSIGGECRTPWTPSDIPKFNLAEYDPATSGALNYNELPPVSSGQQVIGLMRGEGNCLIDGNLQLDNGLLYVNGSLTVRGALKGTGAVVVRGTTTVSGGATLASDDCVALLSEGNVNFTGTDASDYQFFGLVYSGGNFTAHKVTVVGGFVTKGSITLYDSHMYQANSHVLVKLFYPRQINLQISGAGMQQKHVIDLGDGNQIQYGQMDKSQYNIPWATPYEAATHFHRNGEPWGPDQNGDEWVSDDGPWHWYDRVLLDIHKENGQLVYQLSWKAAGQPDHTEKLTSKQACIDRLIEISTQMCPNYHDPNRNVGHGTHDQQVEGFNRFMDNYLDNSNYAQGTNINFSFDPNRFLQKQEKIRVATFTMY